MKLGLGIGLTSRWIAGGNAGGGAGAILPGLRLSASAVYRGALLAADPKQSLYQGWANDPPAADRVGTYSVWGS